MGFFNKLFGGQKEYPPLDAQSPATRCLRQTQDALASLASQAKDSLEVVPAEGQTSVFIGKPPKRFGLAWIEGDEVKNLKHLMQDHGLTAAQMTQLVEQLRTAYEHSEAEQRYQATVAGLDLVVTPSEQLGHEVKDILDHAIH